MFQQVTRSTRIFLLAVSFLADAGRLRRVRRRLSGTDRAQAEARVYARSGARVRRAALRLQGLIVKVGQFLSARSDILPTAFTRELTQLQDAVPGAPFAAIKKILEAELGADITAVFSTFNSVPIAAASLGQVHQATLHGGESVAVKVLRPGIEKLAATDLKALHKVVRVLERWTRIGRRMHATDIYSEFSRTVAEELDYRMESDYLKRFAKQFASNPNIKVPRVYDTFASRRVLVMEFVDGVKVTDVAAIERFGIQPKQVVEIIIDAYLRQILDYGFVHLDPHPGNLFVMADGTVCFLDFGMMTTLPNEDVAAFAKLVRAALVSDLDAIVQQLDKLGFLQPSADREFLKRAVGVILNQINGIRLKRGPELDRFVEDFQTFLRDEPVVVQAKYMFLGRTIGMAAGVCTELVPDIDWLNILQHRALPMLNRLLESENSETQTPKWKASVLQLAERFFGERGKFAADLFLEQAAETSMATLRLPAAAKRVLDLLERGDLEVHLDLQDAIFRLERQEQLLIRSVWILCTCVSALAGLWLEAQSAAMDADWAFGGALLFVGFTLWNVLRSHATSSRATSSGSRRHLHPRHMR